MREAFKRWGIEGNNDEIDAFGLALAGWLGYKESHPVYGVPTQKMKEAVAAISWGI